MSKLHKDVLKEWREFHSNENHTIEDLKEWVKRNQSVAESDANSVS